MFIWSIFYCHYHCNKLPKCHRHQAGSGYISLAAINKQIVIIKKANKERPLKISLWVWMRSSYAFFYICYWFTTHFKPCINILKLGVYLLLHRITFFCSRHHEKFSYKKFHFFFSFYYLSSKLHFVLLNFRLSKKNSPPT